MSKETMKEWDVNFAFEHGYNWRTITATSPHEAMKAARAMLENEEEDIANDASNYDSVGDLQMISVQGNNDNLDYYEPRYTLELEAEFLALALERAIKALNAAPSFKCEELGERMTSYKLLPELEKVLRSARGQS